MTLQQVPQSWTIRDLMKFSIDYLQRHGFDEARLTVELLLSHALHCQRIELYTRFDQPLSKDELKGFRTLFERRLQHEPVQYIVGSAGFMGMQFQVDPRSLIPRPETETLVEQIMLVCGRRPEGSPVTVLEVGTGSGNIAVSVAKLVRNAHVTSIDVDREALEVARGNISAHGVTERVVLRELSVFDSIVEAFSQKFDLLVSNPPYVSAQEWEQLAPEIRNHEPLTAVSDAGDGFAFYRRMAEIGRSLLRENGWILVEVGHEQSETVVGIFRKAGFADLSVAKDLQGIPRIVLGQSA
ncbi:MAG: peptide chain release factor N(5)-glutamine methyltransferase [Ignavibacteriales bacterium]|nr:peptide chain release factor N(5)-glutamine methyltransferase [Ignavibacteriales bacterium]